MIPDDEIEQIVTVATDIREACRKLIARANEHGGEDNITAVLIKIEEPDHTTADASDAVKVGEPRPHANGAESGSRASFEDRPLPGTAPEEPAISSRPSEAVGAGASSRSGKAPEEPGDFVETERGRRRGEEPYFCTATTSDDGIAKVSAKSARLLATVWSLAG